MKSNSYLLFTLILALPAMAEVPKSIPQQGRIAVSGTNFDGIGQFKFLLFSDPDTDHANANETAIWSNASTSPANLSQPGTAVAVPVTKGLYGTWLGDTTVTNMAALPASIEPGTDERLYLRIWFSDGSGFEALAPDQTVAAVPFALRAARVTKGGITSTALADGAVTESKIAAGAVTGAVLADGSITSQKLAVGAVDSGALADDAVTADKIAAGAVTELGTPGQPGSLTQAPLLNALDFDQTGLSGPQSVAVAGNFAYVVDFVTSRLQIFDVSDPNNIVAKDFDQTGLSVPRSVAVASNFAYVVDSGTDRLQIFDVSDPNNIIAKDFDQTGLSVPRSVAVASNFAYVVDSGTDRLQIFDVSDPNNIVAKDFDQTGLSNPRSVAISGNFAYVVDDVTDRLQIFDVSDPNSIVAKDFDQTGLSIPVSVAVSGNFAYVVDSGTDRLQIFDVSDPDNIVAKDFDQTGLLVIQSVAVSGNFAYVIDSGTDRLQIFDVSDPNNIVAKDFDQTGLTNPLSLAVAGNFAYVVNFGTGRLQIFSVTGLSSSDGMSLDGKLKVTSGANIAGHLSSGSSTVSGSLSAGSANVTGALSSASATVSGTVSANDFVYPSPKAFALTIPGCAMLPETAGESYLRSQLGFIQSLATGADTTFTGTAAVSLPQGARVVGMDLMYFDNSAANSFTNFTTRLRRVNNFTTNVSAETVVSLDVASPGISTSPAIQMSSSNTVSSGTGIIDNENYQYFVMVNATVNAPDSALRFYGFRIRYTLTTLAP